MLNWDGWLYIVFVLCDCLCFFDFFCCVFVFGWFCLFGLFVFFRHETCALIRLFNCNGDLYI